MVEKYKKEEINIINKDYYFIIFDYDIRIFNKNHQKIFDINTYPYEPNDILYKFFTFMN